MERRELGREIITTVSGEEKEIVIFSMGFYEKLQLIKKFTKQIYLNGYCYKDVDQSAIMQEVFNRCFAGVTFEELDYNADLLYKKYFEKNSDDEEVKKKEKTSMTSPMDSK